MADRYRRRHAAGWLAAALGFVVLGIGFQRLRDNAAQPSSQAELDQVRDDVPEQWPFLEIVARNEAFQAEATGISYSRKNCGTDVDNVIVLQERHTFSDTVLIMLTAEDGLRRAEYPSDFPLAWLPAHSGPLRNGDTLVFNASARDVVIRKRQSHLPQPVARWTWSWIDYSGLLQLPVSGGPHGTVDGSNLHVMICRDGLHYDFHRNLNGRTPEPQLQLLAAVLGEHAPGIDDGP